jgi:hypothetical protein
MSQSEIELLQRKYEAMLKTGYNLCKYLADWETHKSSTYLNKAREYRRQMEALIKKENQDIMSRQSKITFD